jgi:hypothetical protein
LKKIKLYAVCLLSQCNKTQNQKWGKLENSLICGNWITCSRTINGSKEELKDKFWKSWEETETLYSKTCKAEKVVLRGNFVAINAYI